MFYDIIKYLNLHIIYFILVTTDYYFRTILLINGKTITAFRAVIRS